MGWEHRATSRDMPSVDVLRNRIMTATSALGCKVVRDEGRYISFVFTDHPPLSWNEDFVFCLDEEIYLLDHLVVHDAARLLMAAVTAALSDICPELAWEEL